MLATPGKSQHNLGIAVDVHSASEPKRLNWLIANVKKFGFSWEVVPSETWHLRYVCGDNIPEAVAAFQG
jgi:LAS superfamily LD-carboxypeptidase LdcB